MLNISNLEVSLTTELSTINTATYITIYDQGATLANMQLLIKQAIKVEHLSLSNLNLAAFPDCRSLTKLRTLEIRGCQFLKKANECFFPPNISSLRLNNTNLQMPDAMWKNKHLEQLSIGDATLEHFHLPSDSLLQSLCINAHELKSLSFGKNQHNLTEIKLTNSKNHFKMEESWENCKQLKKLEIQAPIKSVACNFKAFQKLRNLSFTNTYLKDYSFLNNLTASLTNLSIQHYNSKWCGFPNELNFNKLNYLSLQGCEDEYFPIVKASNDTLQNVYLWNTNFRNIPEALAKCKSLQQLSYHIPLQMSLKEHFLRFPNVRYLSLNCPNITELEIEKNLTANWHFLNLSGGARLDTLNFVENLPKLKHLDINGCSLSSLHLLLRKETIGLSSLRNCTPNFKFKNHKQFCGLCAAIERSDISRAVKEELVEYFGSKRTIEINEKWNWNKLFSLASISHPTLKKKTWSAIDKKIEKEYADNLWTGDEIIFVAGKMGQHGKEIRSVCKKMGMKLTTTYDKTVSHVLICVGSMKAENWENRDFIPLTFTQLRVKVTEMQDQFLCDKAKETGGDTLIENISRLLASNDPATIQVALQMIDQGGLPDQCFADLLVLQKTTSDNKIRKKAAKLLEVYAPAEWLDVVRDRLSFKMVHTEQPESSIRQQFRKLATRTSAKLMVKFSRMMFEKTGRGLRYALTIRSGEEEKQKAYDLIFDKGYLDFATGLGYLSNRKREMRPYYRPHSSNVRLPTAALKGRSITGLNLRFTQFESVCEKIAQFESLKQLNLSYNQLEKLPDSIAKLENLEELDLSHNKFSAFPTLVKTMSRLKKLDLRNNQHEYQPHSLEVPAWFKESHPNCEVLN